MHCVGKRKMPQAEGRPEGGSRQGQYAESGRGRRAGVKSSRRAG